MRRPFFASLLPFIVLSVIYSCQGHADREAVVPENVRHVSCTLSAYLIDNLCEDEKEYLDWAAAFKEMPTLADITRDGLRELTKSTLDVDKAAAVFYHRVISKPENRDMVNYLNRRQKELEKTLPDYSSKKILLAIAPGMFYLDNPSLGADGRSLRNLALELGMMETVIPLEQTGTVDTNAEILCNFIRDRNDASGIILASVSKGSSDIKKAIQRCGTEPYFTKVRAWYNIGGINKGSRLINGIDQTCMYKMEARSYFCWNGYNWDGFMSLRAGDEAPLNTDLQMPPHILVVNVIAVPLFRFVTDRARPFYEYLIQFGPNDGMTLLADSYIPEGLTYCSWRNDHYFRIPLQKERMMAFLTFIVERQFK